MYLGQGDEIDARALVGPGQAVGQHAREAERDVRLLAKHELEVCPSKNHARRCLERHHAGRPRLVGEQRHFAEHLPWAELRQQELDADGRIPPHHGDQSAQNQVGGVALASFANDDSLGRELAPLHAGLDGRTFRGGKTRKERDIAEGDIS